MKMFIHVYYKSHFHLKKFVPLDKDLTVKLYLHVFCFTRNMFIGHECFHFSTFVIKLKISDRRMDKGK